MQTELIRQAAQDCAPAMNRFLRDLIRIPGEGQQEESAVARICEEMRRLGFDCYQSTHTPSRRSRCPGR